MVEFNEGKQKNPVWSKYSNAHHHERNHQGKENLLLFPASDQLPQSERKVPPVNGLAGCYVSTIGKPHEYFDLTSKGCPIEQRLPDQQ